MACPQRALVLNKDPYKLAESLYSGDATLDDDVLTWVKDIGGIVISTNEFLALVSTPPQADIFHIYLLAGQTKAAARHLALTLPWRPYFSYVRKGEVRCASTTRWLRHLGLDYYENRD